MFPSSYPASPPATSCVNATSYTRYRRVAPSSSIADAPAFPFWSLSLSSSPLPSLPLNLAFNPLRKDRLPPVAFRIADTCSQTYSISLWDFLWPVCTSLRHDILRLAPSRLLLSLSTRRTGMSHRITRKAVRRNEGAVGTLGKRRLGNGRMDVQDSYRCSLGTKEA